VLAHGDGLLMPQDWNYGTTLWAMQAPASRYAPKGF
jgi:hypothetical protein